VSSGEEHACCGDERAHENARLGVKLIDCGKLLCELGTRDVVHQVDRSRYLGGPGDVS
jgi:hypothetical protein